MKLTLLDLVIFPVAFGFGFLANFAEAATFKLFWSWIIVDMFPNAVTQGLIVNSVSWVITLKIAVFFTIIRLIKTFDKAYAKSKGH